MKILVLGTSNSLRSEGFVSGLKSTTKHDIVNLSIGASPGIQFSTLINYDFSSYDYVLFDSLPNDEEYFYYKKSLHEDDLNNILFEILSTISSQTNLIIINIPLRLQLNPNKKFLEEKSRIQKIRNIIANKVKAQVVDFDSLLMQIAGFCKADYQHLYDNLQHPFRFVSKKIGEACALALNHFPSEYMNSFKGKHLINYSGNYFNSSPEKIFPGVLVKRKNSLLNENFYQPDNCDLDFEKYSSFELVGFYCNISKSACFLKIIDLENNFVVMKLGVENKSEILKIFIPNPGVKNIKKIEILESYDKEYVTPLWVSESKKFNEFSKPEFSDFVFRRNKNQIQFNCYDVNYDEYIFSNIVTYKLSEVISSMELLENKKKHSDLITNFADCSLFFDKNLSRVVSVSRNIVNIYDSPLIPLRIEFLPDEKVMIYIDDGPCRFYFDFFKDGIYLRGEKSRNQSNYLGDNASLIKTGLKFSLKCNGFYFRALVGNYLFPLNIDRDKISESERFSYQNLSC